MNRRIALTACTALALLTSAPPPARAAGPVWVNEGSVWVGKYTNGSDASAANGSSVSDQNGGPTIGDVSLQLIFFGNEWLDGTASYPSQDELVRSVQTILASPYLHEMDQYGMHSYSLRGVLNVTYEPASPFDWDAAGAMVWDQIQGGVFPWPTEGGGRILYMVFMPPNHPFFQPIAGETVLGAHKDPYKVNTDPFHHGDFGIQFAWVAWVAYNSLDSMTTTFSHELTETISDPEDHWDVDHYDQAWLMDRKYNNDGNEIGDACNHAVDRISNVQVQGYWSSRHDACIIPFPAPPTLDSVWPNVAGPYGGSTVHITGTGFAGQGNTIVQFLIDGSWVNSWDATCSDSQNCDVIVPPGDGVADVRVQVNDFTSVLPQSFAFSPSVTGLSTQTGKVDDIITVYGIGLNSGIYFGPRLSPQVYCAAPPGCQVVVPPGSGTVDVRILLNGVWSRPVGADRFSYAAPLITGLLPASGPEWGGTSIGISGQGFDALGDGGMEILFDGVPATSVWCYQSTSCMAYTPQMQHTGAVPVIARVYGVASAPVYFNANYLPVLTDFFVDPDTQSGSVVLDGFPAPGGALVRLHSSDESVVHVPHHVTVPEGSSGAGFKVEFRPSPVAVTVHLRASYDGVVLKQGPYFIGASPPLSLGFADPALPPGGGTTGFVQLLERAPAGGAEIRLSADSTLLALPARVRVPAHQYSATFQVGSNVVADPGGPKTPTIVTVTARYQNLHAKASIALSHIKPPPICPGPGCG